MASLTRSRILVAMTLAFALALSFGGITAGASGAGAADSIAGVDSLRIKAIAARIDSMRYLLRDGPGGHPTSSTCGHPKLLHLS